MDLLKLPRIPDRTPVKVSISLTPDLYQALTDYAALYAKTYATDEPVAELIPALIAAFLESDKAFIRWSREARSRSG